jgi:hypothetical protein
LPVMLPRTLFSRSCERACEKVDFPLDMLTYVLNPCYAHYEHTRGIKGYVTYYLACYVRLQVQNMLYYMWLRVQNMHGCRLRGALDILMLADKKELVSCPFMP